MAAREATRPKNVYVLVRWEGEETHSIVPSKNIDKHIDNIHPDDLVKASTGSGKKREVYDARVIAVGEKSDMEKHQEEMEKCLEGLEEAPESESEESMLSDKGMSLAKADVLTSTPKKHQKKHTKHAQPQKRPQKDTTEVPGKKTKKQLAKAQGHDASLELLKEIYSRFTSTDQLVTSKCSTNSATTTINTTTSTAPTASTTAAFSSPYQSYNYLPELPPFMPGPTEFGSYSRQPLYPSPHSATVSPNLLRREGSETSTSTDSRMLQDLQDEVSLLRQELNTGLNSIINLLSRKKATKKVETTCTSDTSHDHDLEGGCWFGNPSGCKGEERVWVDGVSASELKRIDCQLKCKDLCRKLTELLFTSDELKSGNATEARTPGIKLLNSNRLYAIRVHCWHRFPENSLNSTEEKKRWKWLQQNIINAMCREARGRKNT